MPTWQGDTKGHMKINLWARECWQGLGQEGEGIILENVTNFPSCVCLEAFRSLLAAPGLSQLSRWAVLGLEKVLATPMDAAVNFNTCLEWWMADRRLESCMVLFKVIQQRHLSRSQTMSSSSQGQMPLGDGQSPLASLHTIKETLSWTLYLKSLQKSYGSLVQAIDPFYSDTYLLSIT